MPFYKFNWDLLELKYSMYINNRTSYIFILLIIPVFSYAESNLSNVCKEFRSIPEKTVEYITRNYSNIYKKGLLWKIESPEGKFNYLFGTMHSQDYTVTKLSPEVQLALRQSKTLILETIPNQKAYQSFIDMMYFKDGEKLNDMLEIEFFNELKNLIKDYGIEQKKLEYIKPWAVFSLVGRPKPTRAPNLEDNLLNFSKQHKLTIESLESMEEILSALDSLLIEDQLIILKDTICNHAKIMRETITLVELYVNRDLAGILAFNNQPHHDEAVFERFMQNILYDRNKKMLQRIEIAFKSGNVFVAVGASHLTDEKGLLQSLSKKGYRVTPIY